MSVIPSHTCQSPVCQALGRELGRIRETVLGTGDVSKGFLTKNRNVCVCEIALTKDKIFYTAMKDQVKTLTSLGGVIVLLLI